MTLTAQQAETINTYIQQLRGKFINSNVAVQKFPELQPVSDWSRNENKKFGVATMYCLFVDGSFSHETNSYAAASDFLMDTENSQGFQFNYLLGLSVCADQN